MSLFNNNNKKNQILGETVDCYSHFVGLVIKYLYWQTGDSLFKTNSMPTLYRNKFYFLKNKYLKITSVDLFINILFISVHIYSLHNNACYVCYFTMWSDLCAGLCVYV